MANMFIISNDLFMMYEYLLDNIDCGNGGMIWIKRLVCAIKDKKVDYIKVNDIKG